jgi:hypothetical protein
VTGAASPSAAAAGAGGAAGEGIRPLWPALVLFGICAGFLVWRIHFGVDLTDESFYLASARQFAMGARPFADSWSALQLSGWLASPLVRAWESLTGGTDGLALAMRWAYVLLSLGATAAGTAFLRRIFGLRSGLLAASIPLALIPFVLPTLSYNTLAIGFISIGTSLVGLAIVSGRGGWLAAAVGGASLALAILAYPTLVAVLVPAAILSRLACRSWRVPATVAAAMLVVGFAALLPMVGDLSGLSDVLAFNRAVGAGFAGGLSKVARLVLQGSRAIVREPTAWVAAAAIVYRRFKRAETPWWVAALLLILAGLAVYSEDLRRSIHQAVWLLLGAMALGPPAGLSREAGRSLVWVLGVGALAGLAMGYSSHNAFTNVGLGALAVSSPAIALLVARAEGGVGERARVGRRARARIAVAGVAVVLAVSVASGVRTAYRDDPPLTLAVRVPAGPFKGVLTTRARAAYLRDALEAVAPLAKAGGRLAVHGSAPVAYLFGGATPVAPQVWLREAAYAGPIARREVKRYFEMPGHAPDVVVVDRADRSSPATATYLRALYGGDFRQAASRPAIDVWVRR